VLGDSVFGNAAELRWRLRGLMMECFFQAEEHWLAWAQRPPPAACASGWKASKRGSKWHAAVWEAADGHRRATCLAWKEICLTTIWKKTKENGTGAGWRSIGRKTSRIPIMVRRLAPTASDQGPCSALEPRIAGPSNSIFNGAKTTWACTIIRGEAGEAFPIIWCCPPPPT
jgi:hypothetical protein